MATEPLLAKTYALHRSTRQRLVVRIAQGATTVGELADALSLPASTVRDNLSALESVELVKKSVDGPPTKYELGEGVSACTTDEEVFIRLKPAKGFLELVHPLSWLNE